MSHVDDTTSMQSAARQWLIEAINSSDAELVQVSKDILVSDLWYDVDYLGGAAADGTIARTLQYWRCLSESENGRSGQNDSMSDMMLLMDAKQHKSLIEFRLNAIKVYAQYLQDQPTTSADNSSGADTAEKAKEKAVAALFGNSVLDSEMSPEAILKALQIGERWHRMATVHGEGTVWLVPLDPIYYSPGVQSSLTDSQFELWLELLNRRWPGLRDTAAVAQATLEGFHKSEPPPPAVRDEAPKTKDVHVIVEHPQAVGVDSDKRILESRDGIGPI